MDDRHDEASSRLDMMKQVVAFCNFANTLKMSSQ